MSTSPTTPSFSADWAATLRRTAGLLGVCTALLLVACAAPKPPAPDVLPDLPPVIEAPIADTLPPPTLVSEAITPREYRQDGARHLYGKNAHRIFKGKMPPLMHAVGVLQVELDNRGLVRRLNWMRAPSHAPDVVQEIERTVHEAAPFPAPVRLGGVTYTEVWLWDKSGNFQLDTLTEGQRSK
ncbi:hypothetical protein [Hydrogenophaga sp.]|uniref:hypothetical protein n=1 Tax=Hydrogenophaga sp. TaxID=1904254 RepID=UPI0025BF8FCC|nr:hypothetical protein [Hydrogenophaga sp.]